ASIAVTPKAQTNTEAKKTATKRIRIKWKTINIQANPAPPTIAAGKKSGIIPANIIAKQPLNKVAANTQIHLEKVSRLYSNVSSKIILSLSGILSEAILREI